MSLAERLTDLEGIGVHANGVHRFAWTDTDRAAREWFRAQAERAELICTRDPAGNLWAHPATPSPWWAVGSHLDSVRGGGRFDGPLGVACGFEIAERSSLPVAVVSMADEEGARFNTPTFGSKALTGALDLPAVLGRCDEHAIRLDEAMRADGLEPDELARAPEWLERLAGFIELHIEQSTELAEAGAPIGIVTSLASRMRLEVELVGQADHSGTTPLGARRDALSAAARLIIGAETVGAEVGKMTVTSSRILVEPNATTTIASHVRLWIDARSEEAHRIETWLQQLRERASELAGRTRVEIALGVASRSPSRAFSRTVRGELQRAAGELLGAPAPEAVCFAGHDAGVLAACVPAAMVLVRNPTGISHSPQEAIALEDAEIGVRVIERTLLALIGAS